MSKQKRGKEAFEEYYQEYLEGLSKKSLPILRFNPKNEEELKKLWKKQNLKWKTLEWYPYALQWPSEVEFGRELPIDNKNIFYIQNASSLLPVLALDSQKNDKVLDACAAPGGKALFIAEQMNKGQLTVNDLSAKRMQRLRQTFSDYGIKEFTSHKGNSATLFKKYPEHFDRILLDAPCSSEKHIYHSPKHLKEWSPGRIRQLKQTQLSLINGLYLALKPKGRLVYSTCAINQDENQKVMEKFLKKYPDAKILAFPKNLPGAQSDSPFGQINIKKEKDQNLDPMFIAIIEKP